MEGPRGLSGPAVCPARPSQGAADPLREAETDEQWPLASCQPPATHLNTESSDASCTSCFCEDPQYCNTILRKQSQLRIILQVVNVVDVHTCDGTGGSRKAFSTAAARTLLLLGISSAESTATRPAQLLPAKCKNMNHHGAWGRCSPSAALQRHCLHIPDTTKKYGTPESRLTQASSGAMRCCTSAIWQELAAPAKQA